MDEEQNFEKAYKIAFSNGRLSSNDDLCRPTTALARGVQITEFQDTRTNPQPAPSDRSFHWFEGYLSPKKLRAITGMDDLEKVQFLEMKVDTRETSLGNFGMHLPNLTQLKLSNGIIVSMRDLGSSLSNLQVLWMAQCSMEDIEGVSALVNLQELYLPYNEITDISPCGMLENLQILDVEGNNIADISQLTFLVLCEKLSSLTLEGNPVCVNPSPEEVDPEYSYRKAVKKLVPHLVTLDEIQLLEEDTADDQSASSFFEEDWKLLDELMLECPITSLDKSSETEMQHCIQEMVKPLAPFRPGSARKLHGTLGVRPASDNGRRSAYLRTGVGSRPGSSGSRSGSTGSGPHGPMLGNDDGSDEDPSCELTTGAVICGNLSKALRSRRQKSADAVTKKRAEELLLQFNQKAEDNVSVPLEDDESMLELVEELKQWKENHRKRMEEIEKTKAPEILKIEYNDEVSSDAESISLSDAEDGRFMGYCDYSNGDSDKLFTRNMPLMATGHLSRRTLDSGIGSQQSLQSTRQAQDESIDVEDGELDSHESDCSYYSRQNFPTGFSGLEERRKNLTGVGPQGPFPPTMARRFVKPLRPISGPVTAPRRKFRLESNVKQTIPEATNSINPAVCSPEHGSELRTDEDRRAGTSPGALASPLAIPSPGPSQLRRGLLASVPLLPSKYNK